MGIVFDLGHFKSEVSKPDIPDTSISRLFDINIDLLWFLIPMPIFRPWFERHFLDSIPWEIEKNLSRLASQWTDKINAAIRNIQMETEKTVRDQISTVESLLSQAPSESGGIKSGLEEIETLRGAFIERLQPVQRRPSPFRNGPY